MIQSMKLTYWIPAIAAALFVGWAHCHTDELPIVLGFVLILGCVLGAISPGHFLVSWAIIGAPMFITETLVHYRVIDAPYPPSAGIPFVALVAYVPALIGVSLGAGGRRLAARAKGGAQA
jgi:hypothetical protein